MLTPNAASASSCNMFAGHPEHCLRSSSTHVSMPWSCNPFRENPEQIRITKNPYDIDDNPPKWVYSPTNLTMAHIYIYAAPRHQSMIRSHIWGHLWSETFRNCFFFYLIHFWYIQWSQLLTTDGTTAEVYHPRHRDTLGGAAGDIHVAWHISMAHVAPRKRGNRRLITFLFEIVLTIQSSEVEAYYLAHKTPIFVCWIS